MKTLTEAQMQVLEATAQVGGATSTTKHHRTVASLIKQGLVIENHGDDGACRLVATPAGLAKLGGSSADEAVPALAPAPIAALVPPPELSAAADGSPTGACSAYQGRTECSSNCKQCITSIAHNDKRKALQCMNYRLTVITLGDKVSLGLASRTKISQRSVLRRSLSSMSLPASRP